MANCDNNFRKGCSCFFRNISLLDTERASLITSRNALREKIRTYFKEKDIARIEFWAQGSFAHQTIVRPICGEFDIDDGVYITFLDSDSTITPRILHTWLKESVEGHTQTPSEDREPCVRVFFKKGYHIDFPVYKVVKDGLLNKETYYLGKKKSGWEESDPRAMTLWFKDMVKKNGTQLRRIVQYFKAWKDFRNSKSPNKLPNGLTLTILAAQEFKVDKRDDVSFTETARAVLQRINMNDRIMKPYHPTEDMRKYLSDSQFENFKYELGRLVECGDNAIDDDSQENAAKTWQKKLGERFPIIEDETRTDAVTFACGAQIQTTYKGA